MELIYAELSSPGPVRDNNEDFVGFWQPQTLEEKRSRGAVAVLADGVGGLHHGEVASRMAVETAIATFRETILAETLALDLTAGDHKITCMTSDGLVDQVHCSVVLPDVPVRFR